MVMGMLLPTSELVCYSSTMTSAPKKKWIQHYMQAEDANAEQASEPSYAERNGNAAVAYYSPPASVIQRSGSATSPLASNGRPVAYQPASRSQESSRSPSPGPLNGSASVSASPLHSLSSVAVSNGSASLAVPTRSYQSSPKVIEPELYIQQQQQQQGYSSSGSFSGSSTSSSYRVDDLASRSHRLEEALLRASTKGSLGNPAGLSPAPSGPSSSGRTSADELLELKKRSGAGTREVHNKLEKNRRAHLRECFEFLRKQLPANDDKKLSNLGILKNALRYIQTLKRKEREYEHTMERLAREKIAAQQRLAALRKEVSTIPGYGGDGSSPLDLGNVLPVVLQSQHQLAQQQQHHHQQPQQQENDRSSPLTIANVQAHTLREENNYRPLAAQRRDADQESNSGTSTASERGEDSDRETAPISYLQRHLTARPPEKMNGQTLKRPLTDDGETQNRDVDVKYLRAPVTTSQQTPATTYLTMVPSAAGGVLELADGSSVPGAALYHVRHPSAIFATSPAGQIQLAGPQVLAAHPGVQLLTHSSSLKVLATGPNAPVRVFATEGVSTSLQPIMAVHAPSVVGGSKQGEDGVLNGTGSQGTVFCTPSGVVIPGLVALPPSTEASNSGQGSGRNSPAAGYESSRSSSGSLTSSSHYKPSSSAAALASSQAVLSLSNGLLKAAVNRSLLPPAAATAAGVTHVMTPITVTRSLPLVANMAVMGQPAKHVAHILANPSIPSLDRMGLFKQSSIPMISSPYLSTQAGGRHVIKPVVVVAAPPSTSPTLAPGRDGTAPPSARPSSP